MRLEQARRVQLESSERFLVELQSIAGAVPDSDACVVVIDDDTEFRQSLERLLRSAGLRARAFASIADFVKSEPLDSPTCLVLDVRMPGRSGLEFQRDLAATGETLPIVFITGHGDIPMTVQAMKAGAIEFLTKPFRDQELLDAVNVGLNRDRARRENQQSLGALKARFEELDASRACHLDTGRAGPAEQADRRRHGHHRDHGESSSKQHDAQDWSRIPAGTLPDGGHAQLVAEES